MSLNTALPFCRIDIVEIIFEIDARERTRIEPAGDIADRIVIEIFGPRDRALGRVLIAQFGRRIGIPFVAAGFAVDAHLAPLAADAKRAEDAVEAADEIELPITLPDRAVGDARARRADVDLRDAAHDIFLQTGREFQFERAAGYIPLAKA